MKDFNSKYPLQTLLFLIAITLIYSCTNISATESKQPKLSDYTAGEQWTWKYKGVSAEGEVRSDGTDTSKVVRIDGVLALVNETDTIPVADIVKPEITETPKYKWPLKVGGKWKYENNWTSQDGTTGSQIQDVKVLSFKEETVEAGTFMAYTIQYKGKITTSRGYSADVEDVWLYAPEIKNFIKLTQTQEDFLYKEELIQYSNPNKK
jgi:hypothetical protein